VQQLRREAASEQTGSLNQAFLVREMISWTFGRVDERILGKQSVMTRPLCSDAASRRSRCIGHVITLWLF